VKTSRILPVSLISRYLRCFYQKQAASLKRDASSGEVPVKLEKGTQREFQGSHSATKGRLVSIFGGNFLYAEAESVRGFK
jgi:hypothetical protein